MDIRQKIGERISLSRKKQGWNIKELAEKTGSLSAARISNWENGKRSPGPNEAMLLGKTLNVAASYLLCLSDDERGELAVDNSLLPRYIPVIPLAEANQNKSSLESMRQAVSNPMCVKDKLSLSGETKNHAGVHTFATVIIDNSMSPKFSQGDVVVVDPDKNPKPGDFVLTHVVATKENIVRKYREIEQTGAAKKSFELIALNQDWGVVRVAKLSDAKILGVVIERREYLK